MKRKEMLPDVEYTIEKTALERKAKELNVNLCSDCLACFQTSSDNQTYADFLIWIYKCHRTLVASYCGCFFHSYFFHLCRQKVEAHIESQIWDELFPHLMLKKNLWVCDWTVKKNVLDCVNEFQEDEIRQRKLMDGYVRNTNIPWISQSQIKGPTTVANKVSKRKKQDKSSRYSSYSSSSSDTNDSKRSSSPSRSRYHKTSDVEKLFNNPIGELKFLLYRIITPAMFYLEPTSNYFDSLICEISPKLAVHLESIFAHFDQMREQNWMLVNLLRKRVLEALKKFPFHEDALIEILTKD